MRRISTMFLLGLISVFLTGVHFSFSLDVRLVDGQERFEGRVEVRHDGVWGTVCDDGWDLQDAHVVCRMLGLGSALQAEGYARYGEGAGVIFLDEVDCSGLEEDLAECGHDGFGEHDCQHAEDAGVRCSPEDFQVRLANGSFSGEGRVEVFFEGSWGTVCDDSWGFADAHVVCRMLGYRSAMRALKEAAYGQGSGDIMLSDVRCTGAEDSILNCPFNGFRVDNCQHTKDAGVVCSNEEFSAVMVRVRLADGFSPMEGRVEVALGYPGSDDVWGTICDDQWDLDDARVVCRMLGYPSALMAVGYALYGEGSEDIIFDNVGCLGTEASLAECSHNGYGVHNCQHDEDAGVVCSENSITDVRLVNGRSSREGRVEVLYGGTWGSVYGLQWTLKEADVVCRELGFLGASDAPGFAAYGEGDGMVFIDYIKCRGSESGLNECSYRASVGSSLCTHDKDAGVICKGPDPLSSLEVRLMNGLHRFSGRVEVRLDGVWGTICDDGWDLQDAQVVCRMLGLDHALRADGYARYGEGTGVIFLDTVGCNGYERNLGECSRNCLGEHDCQHAEDAGVICLPEDFRVRLADGLESGEGRVEVFFEGSWGTVCDDSWGLADAHVVCRMLGYRSASDAPTGAAYGQGSGNVILKYVDCTGSEDSLIECQVDGFGDDVYSCGGVEGAGVVCSNEETTPTAPSAPLIHVSLDDGWTRMEGRVLVSFNGSRGTICDADWDMDDAQVVCRMLGYETTLSAPRGALFGQGMSDIILDDLQCLGTEDNLMECGHGEFGQHDCEEDQVAGVVCGGNRIRLADGRSSREGRVEVLYEQTNWLTVCSDGWTLREADVVCRELGFTGASYALQNGAFGEGEGKMLLGDIRCRGDEDSLNECSYTDLETSSNCSHNMDAGVMCKGEQVDMAFRFILEDLSRLRTSFRLNLEDVLRETTSEAPLLPDTTIRPDTTVHPDTTVLPDTTIQPDTTVQQTATDNHSALIEDTKRTFSPALPTLAAILFVSYVIFTVVLAYLCHHTRQLEKMVRVRQAEQPAMCTLLNANALPSKTSETGGRNVQASEYVDVPESDTEDMPL